MSGLAGVGASLALKFSGIGAMLKKVPPKVWYALAIVAAVVAAVIWHQSHAHKALRDSFTAGYNKRADEDAVALKVLVARAVTAATNGAKIAQEERTKNDTDNRNIHAAADTISLRGPGAARCRPVGNSAAPAAPGQHEPANRPGDAADAGLPVADGQGDLAAVPWRWLVANAEECDLNRAEALAWRDADARQRAEWEKLRAPLAKSPK